MLNLATEQLHLQYDEIAGATGPYSKVQLAGQEFEERSLVLDLTTGTVL